MAGDEPLGGTDESALDTPRRSTAATNPDGATRPPGATNPDGADRVSRRRVLQGAAAGGLAGLAATGTVTATGCDLDITKTRDGGFQYDADGSFTIEVTNVGSDPCPDPVTVTDDLPTGLTFVSASGTDWSVSESNGTVTATHGNSGGLAAGSSLPKLTLTVHVADRSSFPSSQVTNCATVETNDDVEPANDEDCEPVCLAEQLSFQGGVDDEFDTSNGSEPADPGPNLQTKLDGYAGGQRDFDDGFINDVFGHTFGDLFPDDNLGEICGAKLEIRLRPDGSSLDYNDTLNLGFFDADGNPTDGGWKRFIGDQPNGGEDGLFDFTWDTDDVNVDEVNGHKLTLYLDRLDLAGGGTQDMLPALNDEGRLDVFVQDDTAVDFVRLTVDYCCSPTTEPCDLVVDKRQASGFAEGGAGSYEVVVTDVGEADCTGQVTVTDDLPDGTSFAGASGTDWSVSASGGTVTATHPGPVPATGSLPTLTVDVNVDDVTDLPSGSYVVNCADVALSGEGDTTNNTDCTFVGCLSGTHTLLADEQDGFETPAAADPRPEFATFIDDHYGAGRRGFDEGGIDDAFGHSFTNLRPHEMLGEICGATLHLGLRPEGFLSYNDRVRLGFFESSGAVGRRWGRSIGKRSSSNGGLVGFRWTTANTSGEVVSLDLTALENADGTTTDLLAAVRERGFLDVYVQDDTAVDFAALELQYCCPPEPTGDCDLTVEKEVGEPFHFGDDASYVIDVCNAGDGECPGPFEIVDDLPAGLTFVSASGPGWSASESGGTVTLQHDGPIPAGECLSSPTIEVSVGPESDFSSVPATVENCVDLSAGGVLVASDCRQHDVTTDPCDVDVLKRVADPFQFGSTEEYVIEVVNSGDGECTKTVEVTDVLPDDFTFVSAEGSGWSVTEQNGDVKATHTNDGGLGPDESLPLLRITVDVPTKDGFTGSTTVENCAVVEVAGDPPQTACVTHTVD